MKKFLLLLSIAFAGSVCLQAQQERKNVVKTNPLGLLFGSFGLTYERAFTNNVSGELGLEIASTKVKSNTEEVKANGFGGRAAIRYFFGSHGAPKGWNITPQISYSSASAEFKSEKNKDTNVNVFAVGVIGGYQFLTTGGFVADLGLGAGYYNFDSDGNTDLTFQFNGIGPMARIGLGYAF
ncbi:porin family protein [Weeksellaceae bacterium TAE3-ERU29]|nr:porin family protein [Weeksellaceae bacterium TAE3-ERU29]